MAITATTTLKWLQLHVSSVTAERQLDAFVRVAGTLSQIPDSRLAFPSKAVTIPIPPSNYFARLSSNSGDRFPITLNSGLLMRTVAQEMKTWAPWTLSIDMPLPSNAVVLTPNEKMRELMRSHLPPIEFSPTLLWYRVNDDDWYLGLADGLEAIMKLYMWRYLATARLTTVARRLFEQTRLGDPLRKASRQIMEGATADSYSWTPICQKDDSVTDQIDD